jgi:ectoine hydroxylase-related dioxygenase (phytanoyl-CoA dioxygenase family)
MNTNRTSFISVHVLSSMVTIAPMRSEQIQQEGYAIASDVLPPDEIARLAANLSAAELHRTRAGARHAMKLPAVAAVASDPRLLAIAQSVLGKGTLPFRATLFDKSPSANWLVAWHQDTALPLTERRERDGWGPWSIKDGVHYAHAPADALSRVLALRLHLDDSTRENGPLRVLPGTHELGVLSDDEIDRVASAKIAVECTAARGGIVAMRPLIIHASSKSKSELPRRVLHIEYAASLQIAPEVRLAIA